MTLRLNGTTSGSVSIDAPATGSNVTLELPTDSIKPGLVLVAAQSFSAVSSVSVNNCFTATYDAYRVVIRSKNTATLETRLRFRAAGVDSTTATYNWSAFNAATGSNTVQYTTSANGLTYFPIVQASAGDAANFIVVDFINPFIATDRHAVMGQVFEGANVVVRTGGGGNYTTTAFDGFTVYTDTSTITGNARVYGYRNSITA